MSIENWHVFLGHPSITTMKHMKMLNGRLQTEAIRVLESYDIFVQSKLGILFQLHRRSAYLFDLVHGDLWGPYSEANICETRYMFTLVEDHSRAIWTYMLHSKDQVYEVLKCFLEMIKTQFH